MGKTKLFDLPQHLPSDYVVDEIFKQNKTESHSIKVESLFNWIKQKANEEEGLTIELKNDRIIFLKGNNVNM